MGETKFNISQVNRPAPLWYRRFSNAMVALVIPAASEFVSSLELSSKTENRVLHGFIFLAAIIKGVGVFLGNGQSYTAEKIAVLIAGCMLLSSCMTEKRAIAYLQRTDAMPRACATLYPIKTGYITGRDSTRYEPVPVTIPGGLVQLFLPAAPDGVLHKADTARAGNLTLTWQHVAGGYNIHCQADSLQLVLDSLREIHVRVDTLIRENTARVVALRADSSRFAQQATILQSDIAKAEKKAKNRLYLIVGMAASLCAAAYFKLRSLLWK